MPPPPALTSANPFFLFPTPPLFLYLYLVLFGPTSSSVFAAPTPNATTLKTVNVATYLLITPYRGQDRQERGIVLFFYSLQPLKKGRGQPEKNPYIIEESEKCEIEWDGVGWGGG